MFAELTPLLKERTLMLTIARIDEVEIQVNIIPKFLKEPDETEGTLTIPRSMTGTAEELDRDLRSTQELRRNRRSHPWFSEIDQRRIRRS
jgi:PRTRC genetic system protein E